MLVVARVPPFKVKAPLPRVVGSDIERVPPLLIVVPPLYVLVPERMSDPAPVTTSAPLPLIKPLRVLMTPLFISKVPPLAPNAIGPVLEYVALEFSVPPFNVSKAVLLPMLAAEEMLIVPPLIVVPPV